MTHPLTPRDKVARIVDPWAFSIIANITQTERAADNRAKALTKADAIIEAIAPSGDQLSGNPGILKSDDHAELAALREHRIAADLLVSTLKADTAEAERKLDEAVGHMSWMRVFVPTVWDVTEERLSEITAFLSKEAERG